MNLRAAWSALFTPAGTAPRPGARSYGGSAGGRIYPVQPRLPGARYNFAAEAGDIHRNSVVAACLGWMSDNIGQSALNVVEPAKAKGDPDTPLEDDAAALLLQRPNPWHTQEELLAAMLLSDKCDGNTYLMKARGAGGEGAPLELWWVPPQMMGPWVADGSENWIDAYWYDPGDGSTYYLPTESIIHIKSGVDPINPRLGCARLKHAVRNIVGLNRAETYTAAILGNGGPLRYFVPDPTEGFVDESAAEGLATQMRRDSRGEDAGTVRVMSVSGRFEQAGSGPQEMALDAILDRPESTVCALMGVDPQVVGLVAGRGTQTFANYETAVRSAWQNGLLPTMKRFAAGLTDGLLRPGPGGTPPDFPGSETRKFAWDFSRVEALADDADAKAARAVLLAGGPVATTNEARAIVGLPPILEPDADEIATPQPATPPGTQGDEPDGDEPTDTQDGKPDDGDEEDAEDDTPATKAHHDHGPDHGHGRREGRGKKKGGHWVTIEEGGHTVHVWIKGPRRKGGRHAPTHEHAVTHRNQRERGEMASPPDGHRDARHAAFGPAPAPTGPGVREQAEAHRRKRGLDGSDRKRLAAAGRDLRGAIPRAVAQYRTLGPGPRAQALAGAERAAAQHAASAASLSRDGGSKVQVGIARFRERAASAIARRMRAEAGSP